MVTVSCHCSSAPTLSLSHSCQLATSHRPWRAKSTSVQQLYDKYKAQVDFVNCYIYEAHPKDEWYLFKDVCYDQPKTLQERFAVSRLFLEEKQVTIPMVRMRGTPLHRRSC